MATSDSWYQKGLRFECTRCGTCCTGAPGYVWLDIDEAAAIAEYRAEPFAEFLGLHTRLVDGGRSLREKNNGDCEFFDKSLGCTIYPVRPRQCRTWPFWETNVRTPEAWAETCEICPGAGQGELIAVEEITLRIRPNPL